MKYNNPSVHQEQRKSGKVWRGFVSYIDETTNKRRQRSIVLPEAKGKREALRLTKEWMDEINAAEEATPTVEHGKTVTETVEEYETFKLRENAIEKSTYTRNMLITKNYITPYLGQYEFATVERADVNRWLTQLYKKGYSQTTIKNAFTQLKKVYNYYYNLEEIPKNPFKGVTPPKTGKGKITHLTQEQRLEFLDAVLKEYKPTDELFIGFLLAYFGGLRREEICGLRWRNIDFDKATITIDTAIGYGVGGNYTKPPKSTSSNRTFPLIEQLQVALKNRYDYIKPKSSWFVIGDKDNFMSLQNFTYHFQKLADKYGLKDAYGKRITPHGLRHNLATMGINSGMDIASLTLMMGHASRAMTLDTYGDANQDALKVATVKLGDKFTEDYQVNADEVDGSKKNL